MKLTPKMWLEVVLFVLIGLAISGLFSLIAILFFTDVSVSGLAFGITIWCVTLFFVGRFLVRQAYYHDQYEREDSSHQNVRFANQKIADSISDLQKLGFRRMGEIISRTRVLKEEENPGWYLVNETIPSLAGISKLGKVAFVTYFPDNGVVTTHHSRGPQICVGNYLLTSTGASTLEDTLERHQQHLDIHKQKYGSPIVVRTIPDLLVAVREVDNIQQERIWPVQRRFLLSLITKGSVAFWLFWMAMQVVFRIGSSLVEIVIVLIMWGSYMLFSRHYSKWRSKQKLKKVDKQNDDPIYLASVAYYSDSATDA